MAIRAVLFDFGGVITSSPFDAFTQLEEELGLPADFIRTVNATNPDENAWARLERSEVDLDTFASLWSDEARALGHEVDGRAVLERLAGQIRPEMVAAIRTCRGAVQDGLPDEQLRVGRLGGLGRGRCRLRALRCRARVPDARRAQARSTLLRTGLLRAGRADPRSASSSTTSASTSNRPGPSACAPSRSRTPRSPCESWPRCYSCPSTESRQDEGDRHPMGAALSATRRAPRRPRRAAWRPARRPKNEPSPRLMPLA